MFKAVPAFRPDTDKKGLSYLALCCHQLNKTTEFLEYLKKACEEEKDEVRYVLGFLFPEKLDVNEYYNYMYNKLK